MGEELDHTTNGRNNRRNRKPRPRVNAAGQWLLPAAVVAGLLILARGWSFKGLGAAELVLLPGLAFLCLWPGIRWYQAGMNWLPFGEVFVALHLFYYVLPCLGGRPDWLEFSQAARWLTLSGVGLFLASFLMVYHVLLRRRSLSPSLMGVFQRGIRPSIVWVAFGFWLFWSFLLQARLLPDVGNAGNVFRSISNSFGSLSVVYLFFQLGLRRLQPPQSWLAISGFVFGLILNFSNGFLSGSVQWLASAALAFTLGRKQLPLLAMSACAALLLLLQLGKGDYREKYWGIDQNYSNQRVGLVDGYATWLSAGWRHLWHNDRVGEIEADNLTKRASLVQVLGQAMDVVPSEKPFMVGQSYLLLPQLMIPRIFWPNKPRGTTASETIGIYIRLQTEEGANVTGISMGPMTEAWINFGWIGFVAAGVFYGLLFGLPAQVSKSLLPHQVGWLVAAMFLVYCANLEYCLVETICSLATTLVMGLAFLFFVSQRLNSPSRGRRRKDIEADFDKVKTDLLEGDLPPVISSSPRPSEGSTGAP